MIQICHQLAAEVIAEITTGFLTVTVHCLKQRDTAHYATHIKQSKYMLFSYPAAVLQFGDRQNATLNVHHMTSDGDAECL